jgi:ATP-binding cassette subfamily B protein/subfamily B ATP-binding cassette protein MsbA
MFAPEIVRVWQELKLHRSRLIIVALAGFGLASASTAEANLLKYVFDGLQQGQVEVIKKTFWVIIAISIFKGIVRYIHVFQMNVVSEMVAQSYRGKLQRKFMALNLTFHNTFASGSGGLISRAMNDILVMYHGLRMFADLFREPFLAIGLLGTLFYLNWKLTISIFIVLPLIIFFNKQISYAIKNHGLKGQEDLEKITGTLKESLDGVRIIQSYNLESEMARKFNEQSDEFLGARRRLHRLIEASGPITEFTMTLVVFSIFLWMAYDIAAGRSTLGDAMAYFGAAMMMQTPVKKVQEAYVRVQETLVSMRRAYSLLDEDSEVPQATATQPFPKDWKQIEYRNVSFRYGKEYVLRNVNLIVERGTQIAFVGASGSGKSTMVNLLERFFDPTEGDIFIDGVNIHDISLHELRHNIALVTQDVFLFSDTIERNIWAGDFSKPESGVRPAAVDANAIAFIERTPQGFQHKVGDRGNLLSGGEKQRISIARAVFKDAPILILDEATSALDSKSESDVQAGLDRAALGRTAFVIAHRLATVQRCHKICVLKSGSLVESGTHQELLAMKGEYFHLYQLQNFGPDSV